jgi:hypothetical protein
VTESLPHALAIGTDIQSLAAWWSGCVIVGIAIAARLVTI